MIFTTNEVLFAFGLTLLAGLSTGVGSALAFYTKQTNKKFLSAVLGFSAGVMIYVSLVEIFAEARVSLEGIYGSQKGYLYTTIAFFVGVFVIAIIDRMIPSSGNPHEARDVNEIENIDNEESELMRMGLFSALAIAIHNFPEGIATFAAALQNPTLGISIAVAVAIHNIPEGIAVSVPVYYATNSRKRAFSLSFLSGLSEPAGAVLGYLILMPFLNDTMFGIIFAGVAGIMVYIALDELLPTAHKYGHSHEAIYGLVLGMIVMASSLILFA
ncbi:MAG: zinc transporter ZupT [Clostridiales bacterium]|nr:zinc transporter ZupT [Clostridiales bacterium]